MNDDVLLELSKVINSRRNDADDGSYTYYLFSKGLDKILKKVGEETAETIIAAKNKKFGTGTSEELVGEVSDLLYHLLVMLDETGVSFEDVLKELHNRSLKTGNKKEMKVVDKNT